MHASCHILWQIFEIGRNNFFSTWIMRLMSTIFSIRKRIQVGKSSRLPSKNKSKIRCNFCQGIIGEWWVTVLKSNVGLSLEIKLLWARVFDPQAASSIRVKTFKNIPAASSGWGCSAWHEVVRGKDVWPKSNQLEKSIVS